MDINERFEDKEMRDVVASLVQDYEDAFDRIRTMTKSDLCAWFAAQAWMDCQDKENKRATTRREPEVPASDVQLCLLNVLGVWTLADISRAEAQRIIEQVQKERSEKG